MKLIVWTHSDLGSEVVSNVTLRDRVFDEERNCSRESEKRQ